MAGEFILKLTPSWTDVLLALVPPNAHYGWNGTAQILWENLTLTAWRAGLVTLTEKVLSTTEHTGFYVGDAPSGMANGTWGMIVYHLASPYPYSTHVRVMSIDWNGQQVAFPAGFEDWNPSGEQNFSTQTFNILAGGS